VQGKRRSVKNGKTTLRKMMMMMMMGKVGVSMDGKGVLDSFAAAAMRGGAVMLQQRLDERRRW